MSVFFEDPGSPVQASSPSKIFTVTEKTLARLGTKKLIRSDSPTTIEACNQLGILPEDLKQKALDDFRDPALEEDIIQLRFSHYMKRYNQMMKDVAATRRRIARKLRNQQMEQQQNSFDAGKLARQSIASPTLTGMVSSAYNFHKPTTSPLGQSFLNPIPTEFNKTVSYFRRSHESSGIKDIDDLLGPDEIQTQTQLNQTAKSPVGHFRKTLTEEIFRFNKIKTQKQREAKNIYEEDMRRIKLAEIQKSRDERIKEKEKKQAVARKKKEEERKKIQEEKEEKLKDLDRQYREQKKAEKEKMKEKYEGARKKFEEENEMKKRHIAEKERQLQMKMFEAKERREKLQEEELRKCDELKVEIGGRLTAKEGKRRTHLMEKSESMKARLDKIEETVALSKHRQQQEDEEYVQKLTAKLIKEEESAQKFKEKHYKLLKKREAEQAEKGKRLDDHFKGLDEQHLDRMAQINERFKKVQDNLEAKRKVDDKNRKMKGELNRLKLHDKFENHTRLQRRLQHERLKILDKEKNDQDKIFWLRNHREFAQKTKLEVAVQSKIEKDHIDDQMNMLSKLVYSGSSSAVVTDSQKKILRNVFRPDDYRVIEEIEKKKEAELKAKLNPEEMVSPMSAPVKKRF